jgi:hypothetical protein
VELQEQEYFDLFVLAWGSISTWKTLDLKNKAMDTKVVVYQLSKTSPEVFDSLWTKTGRLNIIEETKAWKAANRMLGSKWKLQQQIMAKRTTFLEIVAKIASTSAMKASSTQPTNNSPSVSTPRTAVPMNPYAKKLGSWRKKPEIQLHLLLGMPDHLSGKTPNSPWKFVGIPTNGSSQLTSGRTVGLRLGTTLTTVYFKTPSSRR